MKAFSVPPPLVHLRDPYPHPCCVVDIARRGREQARIVIARLWLTEGIPYVFRQCPAVYESMRSWLSVRLEAHAKEIGLVGSARLGRSLAPVKLGQPFLDHHSDLDLFTVSTGLFERLRTEFSRWRHAFQNHEIVPRDATEKGYWENNYMQGAGQITRGFLHDNMIPNLDRYPVQQNIRQSMYELVAKLKSTPLAPRPKEASVRCYTSWDSFIEQTSLNFTQDAYKKPPLI